MTTYMQECECVIRDVPAADCPDCTGTGYYELDEFYNNEYEPEDHCPSQLEN